MAFGLGGTEILILLLAVLFLFFGGKKLPELARGLGKAMGEFQRGRAEFERELGKGSDDDDGAPADSKAQPARPKPGALDVELKGPENAGQPPSKVVVAARALGIPTDGKTEEQLKKEIAALVGDQPKNEGIR